MQAIDPFEGVFALLLTPFQTDGAIDWGCFDRYVDWQVSHQPQGVFSVCGSGEMHWLTLDERLALAARTVERSEGIPVLATANLQPERAGHGEEVARMAATGVAGVVLVPPEGLGADQNATADYLAALADQARCPVFLYEWPQRKPCEISPAIYRMLVQEHDVVGIKDTTCTREGIQAKIAAAPESIVYQANTPYLVDGIQLGARGIMAITSTAATDLLVKFWWNLIEATEEADFQHQQLVFLDAVLRFGYPATAKYLACLRGIPFDLTCRGPAGRLSSEGAKAVSVWWEAYQR